MSALRIMVVEDNVVIGELLAEMLAEMGHDVCAIEATEADAIAAAARCRPDLMIVDVQLRDGCGVSAVEQIVRTGPVPHVFISGDTAWVQMFKPGAVVLQKPFAEADVIRAMTRAVGAAVIV